MDKRQGLRVVTARPPGGKSAAPEGPHDEIRSKQHFCEIKNKQFFEERGLVDFKEPGDILITADITILQF